MKNAPDIYLAFNDTGEHIRFWTASEGHAREWAREMGPNVEVRGASPLAGEASSAEGATSTVVLGAARPGKD